MYDAHNPSRPLEEPYLLAGLIYPVLPIYEDFEIDESTGKTISEGIAWGINPSVRFRLIDRRGRQYYYCRQWARLRREDQSSTKSSSLRRKGMYAGIPKEMIEKAVWDALERIAANPEELTDGKSENRLAFIKKYIARISIDSAGNMRIKARFNAKADAGCSIGGLAKGSTIFKALTDVTIEASIEIIKRPEMEEALSRLYDLLLTNELEGVEL